MSGLSPKKAFTELLSEATRRGYEKGLADAKRIFEDSMILPQQMGNSTQEVWNVKVGKAMLAIQALKSSKV